MHISSLIVALVKLLAALLYNQYSISGRRYRFVVYPVLSVSLSVCPMYCGKTSYSIWMPFGVVGRLSRRKTQEWGQRLPYDRDHFGVNVMGRPIVTNWYFTTKLCKTVSIDRVVIWGGAWVGTADESILCVSGGDAAHAR